MNKNVKTIQKLKKAGKKILCLTAYDFLTAKILDDCDVDIILVGDSLAMVALGHPNTLSITVDEMIHHTKAVVRGASKSLIVADMPFMSYHETPEKSVYNAGRFIKEAGANAVKLEGASDSILESIKRIIDAGIPVLGHLGFTPQYINALGGYYIQGKTSDKSKLLLEQALKLQSMGVFAIVLEMIPYQVGKLISENLDIPTIGIGAGPYCDGQVLVTDDLLGKYDLLTPSFVRKYAQIATVSKEAINNFCKDVRDSSFPDLTKESFSNET